MLYLPQSLRCCKACKTYYPATRQYFFKAAHCELGLCYECKSCWNAARKDLNRKREKLPDSVRRCRTCKRVLPVEQMVRSRNRRGGYDSWCLECAKAESRERYNRDVEKAREQSRQRHSKPEHRQKKNQRSQERYFADIEASRARRRELYYANRSRRYASKRKYVLSHREQVREAEARRRSRTIQQARERGRERYAKNPAKFRAKTARRRAVEGTYTDSDVLNQRTKQGHRCYWCSCELTVYHIDHVIPISRGGTNWPGNIVITCPDCNLSKFNKLPYSEWAPPKPLDLD